MPYIRLLLPLFLTLLVSAQGQTPLPDLATAGSIGEEIFDKSNASGMVLVVVRDGHVFFRGYGETFPGSGKLPTQDSVVRLCSLTKIFTTDALTKLVIDRTVHLDDPLQQFAPEGAVVPAREQSIRLVDLATHTAGLPRELGRAPTGSPHFTYPDWQTRWQWLPKQKLRSVPGAAALYSNVSFDLLSDALQQAAGEPYVKLLAERTLDPLQMKDTTFFPTSGQCSLLMRGARDEGECSVTEQTAGSSGLYSNPKDMTIWLKYLLGGDGNGIPAQPEAAQDVYVTPDKFKSEQGLEHAGAPTGVGLGWIHVLPLKDEAHIVQKTGGGAGFATYIAINHAKHTAAFVATTEGFNGPEQNLFKAVNNLVLNLGGLPAAFDPAPPRPKARNKPTPKKGGRPLKSRAPATRRKTRAHSYRQQ